MSIGKIHHKLPCNKMVWLTIINRLFPLIKKLRRLLHYMDVGISKSDVRVSKLFDLNSASVENLKNNKNNHTTA